MPQEAAGLRGTLQAAGRRFNPGWLHPYGPLNVRCSTGGAVVSRADSRTSSALEDSIDIDSTEPTRGCTESRSSGICFVALAAMPAAVPSTMFVGVTVLLYVR